MEPGQEAARGLNAVRRAAQARNRALYPTVTAFIVEAQAVFGEVRVTWCRENGNEAGHTEADERGFMARHELIED